ncbi:hypothetical protein GCM10010249_14640 [Streptomyces roseolilacinus]|uniref:Uncharacterized protein n=1 Tax=Streptomyces roseolilacinus TaxID=66904 RepID=A0A918EKF1_9ACTN|nr:hypothetical protein GCM10010249_14640 [Streptomyces roseolilacinus]
MGTARRRGETADHDQHAGVPGPLEAASPMVPGTIATENDITVSDVRECLTPDEWEAALGPPEETGDVHPLPLGFRETLATATERMRLEKSAVWRRRHGYDTRHGTSRTDLTVRPATGARRQTPIPVAASCARWGTSATGPRPANRLLGSSGPGGEFMPFPKPGGQAPV